MANPISLSLEDRCENVLIQNVLVESLNQVQKLAWLRLVSKKDFDEHSKDLNTAAQYYGISGSESYNEFDQALAILSTLSSAFVVRNHLKKL